MRASLRATERESNRSETKIETRKTNVTTRELRCITSTFPRENFVCIHNNTAGNDVLNRAKRQPLTIVLLATTMSAQTPVS